MNKISFLSPVRRHTWLFRPAWALLVLLPFLTLTALGAQEGDFTFEPDGARARLTGYTGPGGAVVIPDRLGNLPVTSIWFSAFANRTLLTSVTIPDSVTNIGGFAFYGCTGLTSVTIPNSVTVIGGGAFYGCTGLKAIEVDALNPNYSSKEGVLFDKAQSQILAYPPGKTGAYIIPNSVTDIGYEAFSGCTGLTSVIIPNSVTNIRDGAFIGCTGLTSVTIPNSVTAIWGGAFADCTGLTSVIIPNSVTTIRDQAFSGCTGLTSVTIPNSVTAIESSMFYGCTNLTSVAIPNSVTGIGDSAFSGCAGLTNVTIPNSVTNIEAFTFFRCIGLTSVTIPNSVTYIGYAVFSGCTSLTSVTIPNSVTVVRDTAFSGCTSLTSVTIPNSVTYIGGGSFSGCTGLTSVTIPNSVTGIGGDAFSGCTGLMAVYFEGNRPDNVADGSPDDSTFESSPFVTVFYRSSAAGWGSTFGGRPTAVWVERPAYADWVVSSGLAARFPAASGEADDADGDGVANHAEWFASTDPTQAASRLEIESVPRPADLSESDRTPISAGQHAVYFRSVPGRYYGVQRASSVTGAWELQATRVASATQTRFVLKNPNLPQVFYRVLVLP